MPDTTHQGARSTTRPGIAIVSGRRAMGERCRSQRACSIPIEMTGPRNQTTILGRCPQTDSRVPAGRLTVGRDPVRGCSPSDGTPPTNATGVGSRMLPPMPRVPTARGSIVISGAAMRRMLTPPDGVDRLIDRDLAASRLAPKMTPPTLVASTEYRTTAGTCASTVRVPAGGGPASGTVLSRHLDRTTENGAPSPRNLAPRMGPLPARYQGKRRLHCANRRQRGRDLGASA